MKLFICLFRQRKVVFCVFRSIMPGANIKMSGDVIAGAAIRKYRLIQTRDVLHLIFCSFHGNLSQKSTVFSGEARHE